MPRNDPVLLKSFKTHGNAASNQEMATSFSPYSDKRKGTFRNSRPGYLKSMGFPSSSDNDTATPKPAAQWASLGRLRRLAWSLSVLRGAPLKPIWLIWDCQDATGTPGIEPT